MRSALEPSVHHTASRKATTGAICSPMSSMGGWPTPSNFSESRLGSARAAARSRLRREEVRFSSAQHERRAANRVHTAHRSLPGAAAEQLLKRHRNAGTVLSRQRPSGVCRAVPESANCSPLCVGERAEGCRDFAHMRLEGLEGLENRIEPDVTRDAHEGGRLDRRPDVVHHKSDDRGGWLSREDHAEQAAHRWRRPRRVLDRRRRARAPR